MRRGSCQGSGIVLLHNILLFDYLFILSSLGCSTGGFIVHNWLSNLFIVSIINFNIRFSSAPPGYT